MFGNVVNKTRLKDLLERRAVEITGFEASKMRAIHYPLKPVRVYRRGNEDEKGKVELSLCHDFSKTNAEYSFEANEYVIVEVAEQISMRQDGLIGHFVTPSHFIERGLSLVAGRIESPYGQRGEAVRFGLKNLLTQSNHLGKDDTLAYVYFVDLLSLKNDEPYLPTEDEWNLFRRWQTRKERIGDSGWPTDDVD
jgi:hypothetical protein